METKQKTGLLIIDPQFDFCHPSGKLSVAGAHGDMCRLSDWIREHVDLIDSVAITLDSHQPNDISLPGFWKDASGNPPQPFTQISHADVVSGKWIPKFRPDVVLAYLSLLEKQKEYPHIIWPEHCITGSAGASIYEPILSAVKEWSSKKNDWYKTFIKGEFPFSEHFGALRPQVSLTDIYQLGGFNTLDFSRLKMFENPSAVTGKEVEFWIGQLDKIYIAGEAKSHCVASTLKQIMETFPKRISDLIILEDCMSDVTGLGHLGEPIYNKAKEMGAKFEKASEKVLAE